MRIGSMSAVVLLAFAAVLAAGILMIALGRGDQETGRREVVYEADVPSWSWSGGSPIDQYFALLTSTEHLRPAEAALPPQVWAEAGPQIEQALAEDKVAIVAYLGQAPTGGYAIRVRRVEVEVLAEDVTEEDTDETSTVTIRIARRRPSPDEFVIQTFTNPYDLVTISRDKLPPAPFHVRFVDDDGHSLDDDAAPALPPIRRPAAP